MPPFDTKQLPDEIDVLAPDGSQIRVLLAHDNTSMAHGTLPPGSTSIAVTHRTVAEIWYVLSGKAEVWRKHGDHEEIVHVSTGDCITIPLRTHFQFRTLGDDPFEFIMCTTPPWPGDDEGVRVDGHWTVDREP